MTFTIIDDSLSAMSDRGLRFLFDASGFPVGAGQDPRLTEREADDRWDDLRDGDCPVCIGEDGELYSVSYSYRLGEAFPAVWQRVSAAINQLRISDPEYRYEDVQGYYASANTGDAGELWRETMAVHVPAGVVVDCGVLGEYTAPEDPGCYTLWGYISNGCFEGIRWEPETQEG